MNKPKLKVCMTILQTLNRAGQLNTKQIAFDAKMNQKSLKQCITLLLKQGALVENNHSQPVYKITPRGRKILKFFKLDKPLVTSKAIQNTD